MFQSLFYWKYHFNNLKLGSFFSTCTRVSILILLEVPLQPSFNIIGFIYVFSFNPYFTGSTTSTFCEERFTDGQCKVSILILLEVPLQQEGYIEVQNEEFGFNPYFTGSTTSTYTISIYSSRNTIVSILILLEVPLQLKQH